ncbi:MAG TPA: pectinesterase family protein [Polyangiales bacterium]|nr:pectinesterase family protein [Polyangiales bacterium]
MVLSGALGCGGSSPSGATPSPAGSQAQAVAGMSGAPEAGSGDTALAAGGGAGTPAALGGDGPVVAAGAEAPAGAGAVAGMGGAGSAAGASGAAGSGGAAGAPAAQADLPPGVTALFPGPNARDVCADAPLQLGFPSAPRLGTSGKIQVRKASGEVVATVDLAAQRGTQMIDGTSYNVAQRAFVNGNDVTFVLPPGALAWGQSYTVSIDAGAIAVGGTAFKLPSADAWRFSTAPAAPSGGATLRVALDGSGAYCSLQAAFDAIPARNASPVTIELGAGKYYGIVHLGGKSQVTLRGADRKRTIIAGINNDSLNAGTAKRALFGVDDVRGLIIEHLTVHNLTPQGGSQAEALRMQRCEECVVRDADILSLQDTLLWSGRIYARNCLIAGNVDFVWGTGTAYFDRCEIRTVGRAGYIVQARNDASHYGYVFVDSKLTSDPGLTGNVLARVDSSVYPASHVAFIDCQMDKHISAAAWVVTGGGTAQIRYWEYQSKDLAGQPLDVSRRLAGSKQISAAQAAMMRDPTVVLGGWQPPMQ